MNRYYGAFLLAAGVLAGGLSGDSAVIPAAQASELQQPLASDHERRRERSWDRERNWDRDRDHHGERRHRAGHRDDWRRLRHDDFGDCFRTPWGLACETDRDGVYRVRDRHRGDEPGPDCDVLVIDAWGWWCYDSPRR